MLQHFVDQYYVEKQASQSKLPTHLAPIACRFGRKMGLGPGYRFGGSTTQTSRKAPRLRRSQPAMKMKVKKRR
jgi:hypothetical protein